MCGRLLWSYSHGDRRFELEPAAVLWQQAVAGAASSNGISSSISSASSARAAGFAGGCCGSAGFCTVAGGPGACFGGGMRTRNAGTTLPRKSTVVG